MGWRSRMSLVGGMVGAGCGSATEIITPPPPPPTPFVLQFVADAEDAGSALALGWAGFRTSN